MLLPVVVVVVVANIRQMGHRVPLLQYLELLNLSPCSLLWRGGCVHDRVTTSYPIPDKWDVWSISLMLAYTTLPLAAAASTLGPDKWDLFTGVGEEGKWSIKKKEKKRRKKRRKKF
jgi:hypothetical protein